MFEFSYYHILAALLAVVALIYFRILQGISYTGNVPRVGAPGVLGYILTALQYTTDAEKIILKGRADFGGGPFVVPTLSGPVFLLGHEYLEVLRSSSDEVFNEPVAVSEDLQLPFTMDVHQMENPYQASVLRTDVNRAIPTFIPDILDESTLAMNETFRSSSEDKSVTLPVFDTMTHLIAQISNRVIFGTDLCRNPHFLHDTVRFAETITLIAPFVRWSPRTIRRLVYIALSSILGGKKEPLSFIVPYLKELKKERTIQPHDRPLVAEFLLRAAPPDEPIEGIAMRLMNLNFGSIHTSSIFITQALFELAQLSQQEIDGIREEVKAALDLEGGWTKTALLKFKKIDSALREVGRVYGLMHFALPRVSMRGHDLPDCKRVPPGHRVAIDMKAVHFNPEVYVNPSRCDLFRFSKLRDLEGNDTKYGFATVDSHYLPFGAGRHACAGRFFAAMELKIMLAHILLNYDVTFPPGVTHRPANMQFNGAIIPDTKAQMVFTQRE